MEIYFLKGSAKTPTIKFDPGAGIFEISGRSISEHPIEFYQPLVDVLSTQTHSTLPHLLVTINLEYFNTASSRCIFVILKKLKEFNMAGSLITINWIYDEEDEQMLETCQDFQDLLQIQFNMVKGDL